MEYKWKKLQIPDQEPKQYEEVIVCSDEGKVKSAAYLGNGKWSTYLVVALWTEMPKAPTDLLSGVEDVEAAPKKRGRKKKT